MHVNVRLLLYVCVHDHGLCSLVQVSDIHYQHTSKWTTNTIFDLVQNPRRLQRGRDDYIHFKEKFVVAIVVLSLSSSAF